MKVTESECKINGVHVREVKITEDVRAKHAAMEAVYATIEKVKGGALVTHGRCTAVPTNWSKETLKLLDEMLASMEQDLLPRHFRMPESGMEEKDARFGSGEVEEADQI